MSRWKFTGNSEFAEVFLAIPIRYKHFYLTDVTDNLAFRIRPFAAFAVKTLLEECKMKKLSRFLKSEDGPTAVEYAVMLALIVVVCLGAIRTVGTNAKTTFTSVSAQM